MSVVRDVDRLIAGISRELIKGIVDYVWWFAPQVILDAVVKPYGILVDLAFLGLTVKGLWDEFQTTIGARTVGRFILALFALFLDLWLNLNVHQGQVPDRSRQKTRGSEESSPLEV